MVVSSLWAGPWPRPRPRRAEQRHEQVLPEAAQAHAEDQAPGRPEETEEDRRAPAWPGHSAGHTGGRGGELLRIIRDGESTGCGLGLCWIQENERFRRLRNIFEQPQSVMKIFSLMCIIISASKKIPRYSRPLPIAWSSWIIRLSSTVNPPAAFGCRSFISYDRLCYILCFTSCVYQQFFLITRYIIMQVQENLHSMSLSIRVWCWKGCPGCLLSNLVDEPSLHIMYCVLLLS